LVNPQIKRIFIVEEMPWDESSLQKIVGDNLSQLALEECFQV